MKKVAMQSSSEMTPASVSVLVVTQQVECVTLSIVYGLHSCGFEISLWCLKGSLDRKANAYYLDCCEPFLSKRFQPDECPNEDATYNRVVFETGHLPPDKTTVSFLKNAGNDITLVLPDFSTKRLKRWKMTAGHVLRFLPIYCRRPVTASYQNERTIDFLNLLCRGKSTFPIDAHHKLLFDQQLKTKLFTKFNIESPRRFRFNFIGGDAPDARVKILNDIENVFETNQLTFKGSLSSDCPWFRINTQTPPLGPCDYLDVLSQSDFTVCAPGYSEWSHRIVESLLRGSIPILPASISRSCVGARLVDGKNCLLVRRNRWHDVVAKANQIPIDKLVSMRRDIAAAAEEFSDLRTCQRIAIALGLS